MFAVTCMTKMKNHIAGMKDGELVTRKKFCEMGPETAVDKNIQTLRKQEIITRQAAGVYSKGTRITPSFMEIVRTKAAAFGRTIQIDLADAAQAIGFTVRGNETVTFATDGHTSRFRLRGVVVTFHGVSRLKDRTGDRKSGLIIKGLFSLGKHRVKGFGTVMSDVNRVIGLLEKVELRSLRQSMTCWMRESFPEWIFKPEPRGRPSVAR